MAGVSVTPDWSDSNWMECGCERDYVGQHVSILDYD
eukprot:gene4356-8517_t